MSRRGHGFGRTYTPRKGTSRPMIAGQGRTCERCGQPIKPGDLMQYRDRNGERITAHALCDE